MIRKSNCICLFTAGMGLLFFLLTDAAAAPTAKMIKDVVDYYYTGQKEGPVLTEAKLCQGIKALECSEIANPNGLKKGETIHVWMQFFVPKGASYDDILVEYKHEGIPWRLMPHKIEGSIRYRLVDRFSLDKPGNWTITVKRGINKLRDFKIKVVE